MDALPEPLVAPDSGDLRDYRFMPLHIERLRRSKAWLIAKRQPELGFYMVNLWSAAWHESPVASLEDDDDVLSDAAMCEPKRWPKVKEKVLHGWVKCADGRLYHPVVAELAIVSLETKRKQSKKGREGALARWHGHSTGIAQACEEDTQAMPDDANRIEGNRIESKGLRAPKSPPSGEFVKNENRRADGINPRAKGTNPRAVGEAKAGDQPWEQRCRSWGKGYRWDPNWGPLPGEPNCWAPADLVKAAIERRKAAANGAAIPGDA